MFARFGSGVYGVLSTCDNLHLCVQVVVSLELIAVKSTHALIMMEFKSLTLLKVFGLVFLILASSSSLTAGVL